MKTIIRKIQKSDNQFLAKIIRSCFHDFNVSTKGTVYEDPTTDHLYELFEAENAVLFVSEVDGELCGCCGIFPTEGLPEHCAELVKFYIAKDSRDRKSVV